MPRIKSSKVKVGDYIEHTGRVVAFTYIKDGRCFKVRRGDKTEHFDYKDDDLVPISWAATVPMARREKLRNTPDDEAKSENDSVQRMSEAWRELNSLPCDRCVGLRENLCYNCTLAVGEGLIVFQ